MDIVKERFAAKEFKDKDISKEQLNRILEAIRLSPSSFNLQPWKIVIVKDKKLKEKLYHYSFNQKQIITCSVLLVLCANLNIEEIINNYRSMSKENYKGEKLEKRLEFLRNFLSSKTKEELLFYASNQVYIALTNALNSAKALGIDSCPMTGFDAKAYSKILNLDENLIPVVLVPLGYATTRPRKKLRYSIDDIVLFK